MKDNFSAQSAGYARFRPVYPEALFDFLLRLVPGRQTCWDCATGNGQVAAVLADSFQQVYATDISPNQLRHALQKPNIVYKVEPAEQTAFPDRLFDLIVVAQAIHWFDFGRFYREVNRTLKSAGVLAVIGYGLFRVSPALDAAIDHFYHHVVGPYWDPEREYIDAGYRTIPFPFAEISVPPFEMTFAWSLKELCGYLCTWSAVQHYRRKLHVDPVEELRDELEGLWEEPRMRVCFPLLVRVGKIR